MMGPAVPGDQMRGPGADPVAVGAGLEGRHHPGIIGQAQVVIAAERNQPGPVDAELDPLRGLQHLSVAIEMPCPATRQSCVQVFHCRMSVSL